MAMHIAPQLRILAKCCLLALPLAVLAALYLALDPFMVVRNHDDYYPGAVGVFPNRDWVSSRILLARPAGDRPDAFIFGNSRSMAFETRDWTPLLPSGVRPYHFDASLESLYGVWSKVRYLDRHGYALRDVLMVVDADLLRQADHGDQRALFRKTPEIDGSSVLQFQLAFGEAFLSRGFFAKYCDFAFTGRRRGYMAGAIEKRMFLHDPHTNDLSFQPLEEEIRVEGAEFHRARREVFDAPIEKAGEPTPPVIGVPQRSRLEELQKIFAARGTDLRIVVSPLYDRRPLAEADRQVLQAVFGATHVFDYSGSNDVTNDRQNYYEASHYRIGVARRILHQMYRRPDQSDDHGGPGPGGASLREQ